MNISLVQYSFSQSAGIGQIYIFYNVYLRNTNSTDVTQQSIITKCYICGKQIKLRLCIKSVRNNGQKNRARHILKILSIYQNEINLKKKLALQFILEAYCKPEIKCACIEISFRYCLREVITQICHFSILCGTYLLCRQSHLTKTPQKQLQFMN